LLGHLSELVLNDGRTCSRKKLAGLFLGWLPSKRDLVIVRKTTAKPGRVDSRVAALHRKFHDAPPRRAVSYELPDVVGPLREVGLIKSISYVVPENVASPSKRGANWVHAFGDHGEEGHGPVTREKKYPTSLMPSLVTDRRGNLFIKRRKGNKYKVTEWIYW
jgi:hypothetical protein